MDTQAWTISPPRGVGLSSQSVTLSAAVHLTLSRPNRHAERSVCVRGRTGRSEPSRRQYYNAFGMQRDSSSAREGPRLEWAFWNLDRRSMKNALQPIPKQHGTGILPVLSRTKVRAVAVIGIGSSPARFPGQWGSCLIQRYTKKHFVPVSSVSTV